MKVCSVKVKGNLGALAAGKHREVWGGDLRDVHRLGEGAAGGGGLFRLMPGCLQPSSLGTQGRFEEGEIYGDEGDGHTNVIGM